MTDDDTNEETARPATERCFYQRSELVLNGVFTRSAEAGHHHSLRRPIFIKWETVFCKPIKHLFTLRTTRWTWSAR